MRPGRLPQKDPQEQQARDLLRRPPLKPKTPKPVKPKTPERWGQ